MRNKIISLVSVLFVLAAAFQTGHAADMPKAEAKERTDEVFEESNGLLSALGILSVNDEDSQKGISRKEFAKIVTLLIGMDAQKLESDEDSDKFTGNVYEYDDESWRYKGEIDESLHNGEATDVYSVFKDVSPEDEYYDSIKYAAGAGIMTGSDGYFYPERMITVNEAVKSAAVVLNIGFLCNDDFPSGYITEASKLGVLDDMEAYDGNSHLTRRNASVMLYNILNANVYEYTDISDNSISWKLNKDTCMMNAVLDIYKLEGVVTSDGITGISKTSEKEGYISIEGEYLRLNGISSDGLIGRYAVVYYRKGVNKIKDIVFINKNSSLNNEVVLKPGDIKKFSHSVLTYYDEDGREKTFKLSDDTQVIYNGVLITNYTAEIFDLREGAVKLISNDGNSRFDIIDITKERVLIAGTVDEYNKTIYDKLDRGLSVKLDGLEYKLTDINGVETEFKNITENCILNVRETLSSQKKQYAVVSISQKSTTGKVSAEYTENGNKKFKIDGVGHELSYRAKEINDILLGESYKFYFDKEGKIAYFIPDNNMEYGYLIKAKASGGVKSDYQVKIFCADGQFRIFTLKDKLNLDEKKVKAEDACSMLSTSGGEVICFIADENVITDILRADANTDKFTKIFSNNAGKSYTYRSVYGEYSGFFSDKPLIYMTADTVLMNIPESDKDNDDLYYIEGYSTDETATVGEIYASNSNSMVADVIVVYSDEPDYGADAAPYGSSGVTAVSEVSSVLNDDGEEQIKIKGYLKGKETEFCVAESTMIKKAEKLKAGDLAVITNNSLGNVKAFSKIFDETEMQMVKGVKIRHGESADVYNQNIQVRPSEASKFSSIYRTIHGRVYNKYAQEGYCGIAPYIYADGANTGSVDTDNIFGLQILPSRIMVFDTKTETFEHGDYSDLVDEVNTDKGAEIVVYLYWGTVHQAIIYK